MREEIRIVCLGGQDWVLAEILRNEEGRIINATRLDVSRSVVNRADCSSMDDILDRSDIPDKVLKEIE